jgi:NAD(P)-dependent dehydrogenase (short-subunit alcohol dehydrogenase family)
MSTQKIALVTGANKGLGKEAAIQLSQKGYLVIVGGRKQEGIDLVVDEIKKAGFSAVSYIVDLQNSASFSALAQWIDQSYGKLDVLVNNAGIMIDGSFQDHTVLKIGESVLRETFETNFFGLVLLTQALVPLLRKSGQANVVNVGSILGSLNMQADAKSPIFDFKPFAYNASKIAVNAFTIHLASALAKDGIKVNTAHPGWVKTDLGTEYAPMEIVDGAKTLVDLATLDENGPTGQFIHLGQNLPW